MRWKIEFDVVAVPVLEADEAALVVVALVADVELEADVDDDLAVVFVAVLRFGRSVSCALTNDDAAANRRAVDTALSRPGPLILYVYV